MKKIILILVIILIGIKIYGYEDCNECFETPWGYRITSDYGPRKVDVGSWFHKGIDYGMPKGTEIIPVEGGEIKKIKFDKKGGWLVIINSGNKAREWIYLHLFTGKGETPVYSCKVEPCTKENREWEIRKAILVKEDDETDKEEGNIIIHWDNSENNNKVLSVYSTYKQHNRYIIDFDGKYLMTKENKRALTKSTVIEGEAFAVSGDSGKGTGPHLHLGVNGGEDNPLRYMKHNPDKKIKVYIEEPEDGKILREEELNKEYKIKIKVDSREGLDLDKVDVWVYKRGREEEKKHIISDIEGEGENTFKYGGIPGEEKSKNIRKEKKEIGGVEPINNGIDRFVIYKSLGELKLGKGRHKFVTKIYDVNGNSTEASTTFYIIPEDAVLYASGVVKDEGGKRRYDVVRVKDLKMEATEAEEGEGITPTTTPVNGEIKEVNIKEYLMNVI